MLISNGSCCCGVAAFNYIFAGTPNSTRLYGITDITDGSYQIVSQGVLSGVQAISCNPLTNRVFVVGTDNDVYCMENNGDIVWQVFITSGTSSDLRDLCCTNDNYVYVTSHSGVIYKLNASDGTQVISGGWPYNPGGGQIFNCICVSHTGNVYASGYLPNGANPSNGFKAFSFTSTGTFRWRSVVANLGGTIFAHEGYGICIGSDDVSLYCSVGYDPIALHPNNNMAYLRASTGVVQGALTGFSSFGKACDHGEVGSVIIGTFVGHVYLGSRRNGASDADLWRNNSSLWWPTLGTGTQGTDGLNGVVATRNGYVYAVREPRSDGLNLFALDGLDTVFPSAPLWSKTITEDSELFCVEAQEGRIGAFGL